MKNVLSTPIVYLKGVGPKRGEILQKEANIHTYRDLLNYFPFRYIDKSAYHKVSDIPFQEGAVQLKGQIIGYKEVKQGRTKRLEVRFEDETGIIELIWFKGGKWIIPKLEKGGWAKVYGKAKKYGAKFNIAHPEIEFLNGPNEDSLGLQAVYHSGEKLQNLGFTSKGFERIVAQLLPALKNQIHEFLPDWLMADLNLMSREQAYFEIHQPSSYEMAQKAQVRLKFEELFILQMELLFRKEITKKKIKGLKLETVGAHFNEFYKEHLPFDLTGAQKRVIKEIRSDIGSGIHMNRLLQGDVGSGKTLVALMVMLIAIDNGYQACMMAPTEILANQHYNTICEFLAKMDLKVALLTGSTKKADRKILHEQLRAGEINILVGTHALLEDVVMYKDLGIAIIDEQHRFGVAQRSKLWKKNLLPPHILVMTATPIPRTLALTFYGDLDISVIDEMPPGRKEIQTSHRFESARLNVFQFLENEITKGRQVYIVYPLIQESEKLDYENLMDGYEAITKRFPLPKYKVSIVHGKMKPEDKDYEMKMFSEGKTNIMVATTVIEVGVNVPNASVMVIESAQKFGLSQLHQLRGRVGRGADQSYCILMTNHKLGEDAKKRLMTMVETNDGFKISEVDLKLRGPGDIMGTQQSGLLNLKLSDLSRDAQIVKLARIKAEELIERDPNLSEKGHQKIAQVLRKVLKEKPNWSRIS
ncbi:ATP-dependent DNA helicase RecG [Paracrocinitomix mangrovi]|uniref:ATP-dependent DNA helicase RecG n=1 Tax=Paracrocinitomix mangrovi TaxID=2862509 RepID=UPI001C8D2E0B|nr:ATP-dependent DNA helicase RecG [Paracrocinitomix mangrovi]UKN03227.1 ATP-dependent DNA helicase RecG [Paracrocinitomix mangrovi]